MFVVLAAAIAFVVGWRWYEHPLRLREERIEVRIAPGASARSIARALIGAGLDINEDAFIAVAHATQATGALRAGRYAIERGASPRDIIDKLRRGEVLRERITIVEGWTYRDLRAALAATDDLKQDSAKLDDRALMRTIGAAGEQEPEGLFAPDTYVFEPGSSDLEILRQAYRKQAAALNDAWEKRVPNLPLKSPYEALILASIVEKETGRSTERGRIAGVFLNRLRKGMLLQTDPTVIYGLGERFDGNLRKKDLLTDGPYNTYTRAGLPPTPVALPGRAALDATLNPEPTRALYFVARGDGTSQFSETLSEHNREVGKWQLGVGKSPAGADHGKDAAGAQTNPASGNSKDDSAKVKP